MEEGVSVTQRINAPVSGYVAGRDVYVYQARSHSDWAAMSEEELLRERDAARCQIDQMRQRMRGDSLHTWLGIVSFSLFACPAMLLLGWFMWVSLEITSVSFRPILQISMGTMTALGMAGAYCQIRLNCKQQPERARITLAEKDISDISTELMRCERHARPTTSSSMNTTTNNRGRHKPCSAPA